MGYHTRRFQGQSFTYERIAALSNELCKLFFDTHTGIERLAIATTRPSSQTPPRLSTPLSLYPKSLSTEIFCYSATNLDSISEVRLCQVGGIITGMLLSDSKGSQKSVGQIRLDALSPAVNPHESLGVWIAMVSLDHLMNVSDIEFDPPVYKARSWTKLPWKGSLEWWFSGKQCRIFHDGKELVS